MKDHIVDVIGVLLLSLLLAAPGFFIASTMLTIIGFLTPSVCLIAAMYFKAGDIEKTKNEE